MYLESLERRNLTTVAISSGTPSLFTPMFCAATSSPLLQREWLNLVLISPGQTQLTLISSSSSSLANILVSATKAVLVIAQCPIRFGKSYAAQLARMTMPLSFCFFSSGSASWTRKKELLQLMSHIFWIWSSLAYRKLPIWVDTAAFSTRQFSCPYFWMVSLTSLCLSSALPTWHTTPCASQPLALSSPTVQSMCFLSLLEMITFTPCLARSYAMPLPMPVEEAVMMATFPFISIFNLSSTLTSQQYPAPSKHKYRQSSLKATIIPGRIGQRGNGWILCNIIEVMMLVARLQWLYHARKARVLTEANKSYIDYTRRLRQARRQVHIEAKIYQDRIEDQYLERHKEEMRKKHQDHQCTFRKQVFTNAFRLHENQQRWRARDEGFSGRLNKHLHDEDVRKINRSRILKIMEHESTNYWFNQANADTRLKEETIFPEYIASTEYYYKLFAEALAYEFGNFQELHLLTSNEEILREKNKLLIPLYLQLRTSITNYKRDETKQEIQRLSYEMERLRSSKLIEKAQLKGLLDKEEARSQAKLREIKQRISTPEAKLTALKQKVRDLTAIFKLWKEYTNVVGLTSAQVIRNQNELNNEISINRAEKEVLGGLLAKEKEIFISSIEEDTEEQDISFEEYLGKINRDRLDNQVTQNTNITIEELDALLKSTAENETPSEKQPGNIKAQGENGLNLGALLQGDTNQQSPQQGQGLALQVNPQFLNLKETTSSVQVLKQVFKKDQQFVQLLNQLGQIDVRYPKLLETVWKSIDG